MEKVYNHLSASQKRKSENEYVNEIIKFYHLFINCPTLFWFFNWSQNIDQLLHLTSLIGKFSFFENKFYFSKNQEIFSNCKNKGLFLSMFVLVMGSANFFIMTLLWLLYHSIVNIGQTWYSFGWESQLLESGFIGKYFL